MASRICVKTAHDLTRSLISLHTTSRARLTLPLALSSHRTPRLFSTTRPTLTQSTQGDFKDPWPLPHSPKHMEKTTSSPDSPPPQRIPRPGEPVETLRARLVYQSRKRGTLESDLLLSTFAKERLGDMSEGDLKEFDRLMDEPDWDIYYWATEKKAPPPRWENSTLLESLRQHARNEGKVVRRMPDLI